MLFLGEGRLPQLEALDRTESQIGRTSTVPSGEPIKELHQASASATIRDWNSEAAERLTMPDPRTVKYPAIVIATRKGIDDRPHTFEARPR